MDRYFGFLTPVFRRETILRPQTPQFPRVIERPAVRAIPVAPVSRDEVYLNANLPVRHFEGVGNLTGKPKGPAYFDQGRRRWVRVYKFTHRNRRRGKSVTHTILYGMNEKGHCAIQALDTVVR